MGTGPTFKRAGIRHDSGAAGAVWIVVGTFLALVALTAALVAAFSNSTSIADRFARTEEQRLVERFIERTERQILEADRLQIAWDDAVVKLNAPDAEQWARNFLAGYFWGSHRIDRIYHVRFWKCYNTSYVSCTEVELWTVVVKEWSVASAFIL